MRRRDIASRRRHSENIMGDLHDPSLIERLGNISDDEIAKLPERQRLIVEHHKMHEKHKGHEAMHLEMFLILILSMFVCQVVLIKWKKSRPRSYNKATLLGMWAFPPIFCAYQGWYRFITTWVIFTILSALVMRKASAVPIRGPTARYVYRFFLFIHQLSYFLGIFGYILFMLTLMGFNLIFLIPLPQAMDGSLLIIFYGLYYGVVGRDLSEVCSETMASHIGFYRKEGLPAKSLDSGVCAICGNQLITENPLLAQANMATKRDPRAPPEMDLGNGPEKMYKLDCGHVFHEFCIRGWCIVGKKQTCPYCKEKLDLQRLFPSPWSKPHVLYGDLLDYVRYLVAWQPLILALVQGINWVLKLE